MDLSKYAAGTRKYMSKDLWDPNQGEDLTIANIREVTFSRQDGTHENKLVVDWVEDRPPLTLNKTNLAWLLGTFGPKDEDWGGKKVHVFHDPTVKYAGRAVGGVVLDQPKAEDRPRAFKPVRAQKPGPDPDLRRELAKQQQEAQAHAATEDPDDDIPF